MPLPGVLSDLFSGPEYSVLLCGLDGAGKTTLLYDWHNGDGGATPGGFCSLNVATVGFGGRGKVTFRDLKSHGADAAPEHLHDRLRLSAGQSALLFVHDANGARVEESLLCLRRNIELLYKYGGRGVWVLINKLDLIPPSERLHAFNDLRTCFEFELCTYGEDFRWQVLTLPAFSTTSRKESREALDLFARELSKAPVTRPSKSKKPLGSAPAAVNPRIEGMADFLGAEMDEEEIQEWWNSFLYNKIKAPWKHVDYLRAVYMTVLDPENGDRGLLEVATNVATRVHSFKQRDVSFPLPAESRTLTVFWVYHVKLAIDSYRRLLRGDQVCFPQHFACILEHMPELLNQKLPSSYFSSDLLGSKYPEQYWVLPDLQALTKLPQIPTPRPGQPITLKSQGNLDRPLRFAFAVVQRYLRKDSTRRRSWFIDLAFAAFQQQTIRLRIQDPSIPVYSVTHIYFYVQIVHIALSQLLNAGTPHENIERMSYPAFKDLFQIPPTIWTLYYSQSKWYSLEARVTFLPPDLRAGLPNRIDDLPTAKLTIPPNHTYHSRGLLPELPSTDALNFHLAILLEDAKALPSLLSPSQVTSHAALLSYIHTHIIAPRRFHSSLSYVATHLSLLATRSPFSSHHLTFWTTQSLLALDSTTLPATPSHPRPWKPSGPDPVTGIWTRYHNCPCHPSLPMPSTSGPSPSAVSYPADYPYEHPPQHTHACLCHSGEPLDEDAFAALCGQGYAARELEEKRSRGVVAGPRTLGRDQPWENFMRFNPALAWEGLWGVWYSERAWEGGVEADRKGLEEMGFGEGDKGEKEGEGEGKEQGEGVEGEEGKDEKEVDRQKGAEERDIADEKLKPIDKEGVQTKDEDNENEDDDEEWEVVA